MDRGVFERTKGPVQSAKLGPNARSFGRLHAADAAAGLPVDPAASIAPLGPGPDSGHLFQL